MTKNILLEKCNQRFETMDIWYIIDNFEQLKVIRGIISDFTHGRKLTPRQTVRLYDFSNGLGLYITYTKDEIRERYNKILEVGLYNEISY